MKDLINWYQVTRGIYRYVTAANVCYEIHIFTWNHKTDILSSNAKLYLVGEWRENKDVVFRRELLYEGTLAACLEVAIEDNEENNM